MKIQLKIAFLIIFLAACAPSPAIPVDAQNTAMAVVQTYIALTQTAAPTPTVIPTVTPQATLIPTLPPPPIITPDAIHVERWQEYQRELIKALLIQIPSTLHDLALCEWDILGRFEQKLYVWALCRIPGGGGADIPAIIHINIDGSVQNVEVPSRGPTWESDINKMFPKEVQEKFGTYTGYSLFDGRIKELKDHLNYREQHPEEPPLVVLASTITPIYTTPSPLPTQPPISIFTPDAIQIERWREYQSALAKKLVSKFPVEIVLCEWDILGRSEREVYVWAVCAAPGYVASKPAVIYFKADGAIQDVEIAVYGSTWDSDIQRLFPEDVQEKIASGIFLQRSAELINHIEWRRTHLDESPLIILSAMPAVTPTP